MAESVQLDATDYALLAQLQEDSSLSNQDLASKVHVSPATCLRRGKRPLAAGLIEREMAVPGPGRTAAAPRPGMGAGGGGSPGRPGGEMQKGVGHRGGPR